MKFFFTTCFMLFLGIFSNFAQLSSGKLFVLHEGSSAQKGTIGYVDYATNTYTHIDSIARYGNQIEVHNQLLYVIEGLGNIRIYDIAANYMPVAVLDSVAARGIAFWGNKMLVTSIEEPFFRVYEKTAPFNYLSGLGSSAVRSEREEVIVVGQQAYLSGFYGDSVVYAVDLVNNTATMIETALNPYQIEAINGKVYVACFSYNADFTTNTAISRINPATNTIDANLYLPYADGFTSSNTQLYQKKSNGKVLTIDAALQVVDTTSVQGNFYGFQYDKISNNLFYSETDYVSTGSVGYIQNTTLYPAISTNLSPRAFYFMSSAGVSVENTDITKSFTVYPNPAKDVIFLQNLSVEGNDGYEISDMAGKKCLVSAENNGQIEVSGLPEGVYFLQIKGLVAKFVVSR